MDVPKTKRRSNPDEWNDSHMMSTSCDESMDGGPRRSKRSRGLPVLLKETHKDNEMPFDQVEMPVLAKEGSLEPLDDIPSTSQSSRRLPNARESTGRSRSKTVAARNRCETEESAPSAKKARESNTTRERSKTVAARNPSKTPSAKKNQPVLKTPKKSSKLQDTRKDKKAKEPVRQREESVESEEPVVVNNELTFTVPPRPKDPCRCFMCSEDCITSTRPDGITGVHDMEVEDSTTDTSRLDVHREDVANTPRGLEVKMEELDGDGASADPANSFLVDEEDVGVHEEVVVSMDAPSEGEDVNRRRTVEREQLDEYETDDVSSMNDTRLTEKKEELDVKGEKEEITKNNSDSDYIMCGMDNCKQRMHIKCLENYICSEYSPRQAQLLFNVESPVCPAHFCWHCYEERSKNSARFDELVDCEECMRSFHLSCIPAGTNYKINGKKERKTLVCHSHSTSKPPKIVASMRLKYCTECEELFDEPKSAGNRKCGKRISHLEKESGNEGDEDGMQKMECKGCTNVYHKKCGYKEVKGLNCEQYANQAFCTYCTNRAIIVPKQKVLAYYGKSAGLKAGNYPAEAVTFSDIPLDVIKNMGANFGKIGYIPVRWIWDNAKVPFFNVVHASQVQRMTRHCEKNLPDGNFINELKKCENKFSAPTHPLNNQAMKRTITIIRSSFYSCGLIKKDQLHSDVLYECECKPNGQGIKCDTSDCLNRHSGYECPKSCDEAAGKCANRSMQNISREKLTKKYEVKPAPDGKGMGVFATTTIKPLDFIFEYAGEIIDKEELAKRENRMAELRSNDEWTYTMGLRNGTYVDARFKGGDARFANHSCSPNAVVKNILMPVIYVRKTHAKYEYRLKVEALRTIRPGEEITFDYQLEKSRGLAIDNCRCGAKNCKGKIGKKRNKDDGDDERFDAHQLTSDSEGEGRDEESDEEKENQRKKRTPKRKTPKKNEKSEETKTIEKKAIKRSLPRSFSAPMKIPKK